MITRAISETGKTKSCVVNVRLTIPYWEISITGSEPLLRRLAKTTTQTNAITLIAIGIAIGN